MSLITKWFDGIPLDQKKDWETLVRNSNQILGQLTIVFKKEIESLEAPLDISDPNWSIKMAERQGQLRAYRNVIKMVDLRAPM